MKSFKKLQEVLKKSTPIDKWISDFVHSDDPKFAGKSKEERINMAKGAYYGAQKEDISIDEEGLKDTCWKGYEAIGTKKKNGREVPNCVPVKESDAKWEKSMEKQKHDNITDKDKSTLGKVADLMAKEKAKRELDLKLARAKNGQRAAKALGEAQEKDDPPFTPDPPKKNPSAKAGKYGLGHSIAKHLARQAMKKLAKEEDTNENFASDAQRKAVWASKNEKGVKEEVEQIDEISKDTLRSYADKAFQHGNDLHYDIAHERDKAEKDKMKAKLSKRNDGVIKAAKKLREEETVLSFDDFMKEQKACSKEELHPNQKKLDKNKNGKLDAHDFKLLRKEEALDEVTSPMQKLKDAHERHMQKALAANKAGDDTATKVHQQYMQKITAKMNKLKQNEEIDLAEMEELCEISKDTLKSYVKGAAQDLPRLGNTLGRLQTHGKLKGVEDKIAKSIHNRYHGINKATEKLTKEEVEQIDELDKKTLGSYVKKSHDQLVKHSAAKAAKYTRGDKDSLNFELSTARKEGNRQKGIDTAVKKLTKEETVEEAIGTDHVNKDVKLKRAGAKGLGIMDKLKGIKHGFDAARKGESEDELKLYNKSKSTVKEDNEMITFKELLENISEGKIDDLKDKLAAQREKRLNSYDFSKEKDKKSNVTKVKGHSYGAGEEEGEDDDDTQKVSKPAKPEVKRGRGRPAGSKSGARN